MSAKEQAAAACSSELDIMPFVGRSHEIRSITCYANQRKETIEMNKRLVSTLTAIGIPLLICGCGKESPSIVGKWVGTVPNSEKITYHFKEDNTLIWTVDSPDSPFSTSAKYSIDYTTNPIQIDIFDFSFPPLKEFLFFGIIEFKGSGIMILYGEPSNAAGGETKRPQKFGADSVEFKKSK